jgi:hypothetical protein
MVLPPPRLDAPTNLSAVLLAPMPPRQASESALTAAAAVPPNVPALFVSAPDQLAARLAVAFYEAPARFAWVGSAGGLQLCGWDAR